MNYEVIKDLSLYSDHPLERQAVPLYDLHAWAGFNSERIDQELIRDYIEVAGIAECNASIFVNGDSMEPICTTGDIAVFKIVPNRRGGLYFGNIYVVAFEEDGETCISIKYVRQSKTPGYYRLESENPRHKPVEIPISCVRLMGLVKAFVRRA